MREQLKNEIKILEIVEHKNIVNMDAYFEDHENIYLVMELANGHLYELIKKNKKVTEKKALKVKRKFKGDFSL